MPIFNPGVMDYPREKSERATTRWVVPGYCWGSGGTVNLGTGKAWYIPIFVPKETTYIRIGCQVTTLEAGKSARLGIYEFVNGLPGAVVLDAGTVSLAAVAAVELTISETLARNPYLLCIVSDATGTAVLRGISSTTLYTQPTGGYASALGSAPSYIILSKTGESAQVAAGLTDPAPTPDGEENGLAAGFVMLREN